MVTQCTPAEKKCPQKVARPSKPSLICRFLLLQHWERGQATIRIREEDLSISPLKSRAWRTSRFLIATVAHTAIKIKSNKRDLQGRRRRRRQKKERLLRIAMPCYGKDVSSTSLEPFRAFYLLEQSTKQSRCSSRCTHYISTIHPHCLRRDTLKIMCVLDP